jgi:Ca2+-binding EF-hand superfamily protein
VQFAADYFAAGGRPASKAEEIKIDRVITSETRHAVAAVLEHGSTGAIGELEDFISVIFNRADKDGSGALDTREFKNCVLSIAQQVGLQQADVRLLMSMADSSSDGYIQYQEFLPVALQLIGLIVAKASHKEEVDDVRRRAEDEAQHKLVHGMPREEVYDRLMKAFTAADTDADGMLSRDELQHGLQSTALGLSRRDINLLISEVRRHTYECSPCRWRG